MADVAQDRLSLKFLHFKFIAVHVTGWEIYIVLHFELTLDFRFYCLVRKGKSASIVRHFGCHAGFKSLASTKEKTFCCYLKE